MRAGRGARPPHTSHSIGIRGSTVLRAPNTTSCSVSSIVSSASAAPRAALATAPEATERVAAEERVEQVVEPEVARGSGSGAGAAVAVVAEHVVAAPAFGVAQRLVRRAGPP